MDFQPLLEKLKAEGLEVAEDAAKVVVEAVLEWAEDAVTKSENKYDDLLLAVLPVVKAELLKLVDEIDGEEG